ncbi:MAG: glutamyl-tRNA reductase, partial [Thermobispora bispora]|nr:glutamyl-tRNA reductase [Thermobispora bispora]
LNELTQHALRVGKRARTETAIDRAGASLVGVGLSLAEQAIGQLPGKQALVVGAGSMSSLATATLARAGVTGIVVANRTLERAVRLAESVGGRAVPLTGVAGEIGRADLVVSCVGAGTYSITEEMVEAAMRDRRSPLFVLDLAMPRDVDPAIRRLPGVTLVDLESMQQDGLGSEIDGGRAKAIWEVKQIIAEEVDAYLDSQRASVVTPTVVALRSKAAEVVEAELARLWSRIPDADTRTRDEITNTVRRVVDKLLHAPTVRVKQLATSPGGAQYAHALRELFDLDPQCPDAVTGLEVER